MHKNALDQITYPFLDLNDTAIEVWKWINDLIPIFTKK